MSFKYHQLACVFMCTCIPAIKLHKDPLQAISQQLQPFPYINNIFNIYTSKIWLTMLTKMVHMNATVFFSFSPYNLTGYANTYVL